MIRGLYTSSTGMIATQMQGEVVGDNIANVRTSGYKERLTSNNTFPTLLTNRMAGNQIMGGNLVSEARIGVMGVGVGVDPTFISTVQGSLQQTDIKADLALGSDMGYFAVQTPDGERYTRNGHFELDANGMLQTPDGNFLLDTGGAPVGPLSPEFMVDTDGAIYDNNRYMGHLRIVDIPGEALVREGQSLYTASQEVGQSTDFMVKQGFLEASNVDIGSQMVKMINIMRAYEANQRVIQTQDEMIGKAVNEVGKMI